jgi:radical SAM superfamily enzyme YgiQ (UPF0313 family)
MELPLRSKGDETLPPGAMIAMRARMRELAARHPTLSTVVGYPFDLRTRMLPYYYVDRRIVPAGPRELTSALIEAGFERTRLVMGAWNPKADASQMRLDGEIPDLFLLSVLSVHSAHMDRWVRQLRRLPEDRRPLVIMGGPHVRYEPWRAFGSDPAAPWGADLAVTGELYVFLQLLDALLSERASGEPLRRTFARLRDRGELDAIPGLCYPLGSRDGVAEELVDTGMQRLLADFDELPSPIHGYAALEPPGRFRETLSGLPLPPERVRTWSPFSALTPSQGCKFRCPYCPIPAYNQNKFRRATPERMVEDFQRLYASYGLRLHFGVDDNAFNDPAHTVAALEAIAGARTPSGKPLGRVAKWMTSATLHDTHALLDHVKTMRASGLRGIFIGVEDLTATLVKKGQSVSKTAEVFHALRMGGVHPMPLLIHDDSQPLLTFKSSRGLLNQVQLVRNLGALSIQLTSLMPCAGTKLYKETYQSGMAYQTVGGREIEPRRVDGNHVVASLHPRPWQRQMNLLVAYSFFYNPLRWLKAWVFPKATRGKAQDAVLQTMGMVGLARNWLRIPFWALRLLTRKIVRATVEPRSPIPMRTPEGAPAPHESPPGPDPKKLRRLVTKADEARVS